MALQLMEAVVEAEQKQHEEAQVLIHLELQVKDPQHIHLGVQQLELDIYQEELITTQEAEAEEQDLLYMPLVFQEHRAALVEGELVLEIKIATPLLEVPQTQAAVQAEVQEPLIYTQMVVRE